MGLRWLADNIKDYDPSSEGTHNPFLTRDIVHICQLIGMNQITEKNYVDWYTRWIAAKLASGESIRNPVDWPHRPGEYIITLGMVKSYVGLSTNANRMTDFQFKKALAQALLITADGHVRLQESKGN